MTPDIERVARAICKSSDVDDLDANWELYIDDAIAAIKAMEHVSIDVLQAIPKAYNSAAVYPQVEASAYFWDWLQGHRAMIRAALG
jgi:hypothetical protein